MEGSGAFRDDSFAKEPRLINPKSCRADTCEVRMLYGERRDRIHGPLPHPCGFLCVSRISIFSASTKEIYAHLMF